MSESEFEELSHNETYVSDIMQDNDGLVASFMTTHDGGNGSTHELVHANSCVGQSSVEGNHVDDHDKVTTERQPFVEGNVDDYDKVTTEEPRTQEMILSPGGSKQWIPVMDESRSIWVGQEFESVDSVEQHYREYADIAGFDIRLSNKKINKLGLVQTRYFVCSKEGVPTKRDFDSIDSTYGEKKRRRSRVKRTGCKACVKVHYMNEVGRYVVYKFIETHNHMLFLPEDRLFSRANRTLGFVDRTNVFNACSSKVGITQLHRMNTIKKGGIERSGGSARDHLNFKRDVIHFIGNKDAQMFVNKLTKRREYCPGYFFEYKVEGKQLVAIFWADETAQRNYKEFGDTVSFDATYRTNQYAMIFVPFVAVDNHKKSVVVGASLIASENVLHFTWVLQAFMKVHGTQPKFVMTDQCPSMKQAIPIAFPDAKHRLCMWHITNKFKEKVRKRISHKTNFKSDINKLVWNVHLQPEEFELRWNNLMDTYSLRGDPWWDEIYAIRESWIPAYFKDCPMSGLMRTTSRSESINSFFRVFARFWDDLVFFINKFDHAIEEQHMKHCELEVATRTTVPRMLSPSRIEAQLCDAYTRTIFWRRKKELNKAVWCCMLKCDEEGHDYRVYQINHLNKKSEVKTSYTVVHKLLEESYDCSCHNFVRNGILCHHVFKVMLNDGLQSVPEKYILRRWRRGLVPVEIMPARARYGELDVVKQGKMNKAISEFDRIIGMVRNDDVMFDWFLEQIGDLAEAVAMKKPMGSNLEQKKQTIEELIGVSQPDSVEIMPPSGIRNKGRARDKRYVGAAEKAAKIAKKPKRFCRCCQKEARHDSRNCPAKRPY